MIIILILLLIVYFMFGFKQNRHSGSHSSDTCISDDQLERLNKNQKLCVTLDDIPYKIPYSKNKCVKSNLHYGQLKLLLSEIQFITPHYKPGCIFVYVGSAPNHKAQLLNDLFPQMKIVMIDPAEHLIYYRPTSEQWQKNYGNAKNQYEAPQDTVYFAGADGNRFFIENRPINLYCHDTNKVINVDKGDPIVSSMSKIFAKDGVKSQKIVDFINNTNYTNYMIEDFFTDDLARLLSKLDNVLFMSDIRTTIHDIQHGLFGKVAPSDLDICANNASVLSWLLIMKPQASLLKMRLPYFDPKDRKTFEEHKDDPMYKSAFSQVKDIVDFVEDYRKGIINYIKGTEFIQPYCKVTSGETRLLVGPDIKIVKYDHLDREAKLFYYNTIVRTYAVYEDDNYVDKLIGLDRCADCALACRILNDYYNKCKPQNIIKSKFTISVLRRLIMLMGSSTFGYHDLYYKYLHGCLTQRLNNTNDVTTYYKYLEYEASNYINKTQINLPEFPLEKELTEILKMPIKIISVPLNYRTTNTIIYIQSGLYKKMASSIYYCPIVSYHRNIPKYYRGYKFKNHPNFTITIPIILVDRLVDLEHLIES